jgi:hypothetical protein
VSTAHVPLETAFQMVDAVRDVHQGDLAKQSDTFQGFHQREMTKFAVFSVVLASIAIYAVLKLTRDKTSSTPTPTNSPAPTNTDRPQDQTASYLR